LLKCADRQHHVLVSAFISNTQDVQANKLFTKASVVRLPNGEIQNTNNTLLAQKDLWNILEKYKDASVDKGKSFITYPNFLKAKEEVCLKAKYIFVYLLHLFNFIYLTYSLSPRRYFTATIFAKLCHGERFSRVNILSFFNYVMKTVWLQQTRIGISLYDAHGDGYLREGDLENYISELIPSLCKLNGVDDAFRTFYVCTAVRKFLFFLDPLRAGRVRICDILACGFLDNILELREASTTQARLEENWFSLESAKRVYASYLRLDTDQNGMLSRKELAGYNNGSLTDAFLDRVFQECLTYEGEMDYKVYLDFVLAMENRGEPQSIAYIFRIVDLGGQGRLCVKTVEYYLNSLLESLGDGPDTPRTCDIINEIFDMVRPKDPDYITLDDLLKSGKGDTVLGILTDIQCFMLYENREALAAGIQPDIFDRSAFETNKENAFAIRIKKASEILTDEEIKNIFTILNKYTIPSSSSDESYISYPLFIQAKQQTSFVNANLPFSRFFSPIAFAKLSKTDKFSLMKLSDFYAYVIKMTWLYRTRVELSKYDAVGKGYLIEYELEHYLKSQLPFLNQIKDIERWFIPYYLCTVSRRFFFFLDPIRVGRVRICDVMASGLLESFFALGYKTKIKSENDYFTLSSVKRVYDNYVKLDINKDGSLSRNELSRMSTGMGHLSKFFIDFFFATHPSRNGVIDYRTYMDLVLALENRESTQSIRYLFNAFDIAGHGKLKISMIEDIFNESDRESGSKEFLNFYSFVYDKFKIKDPEYITLNELLNS
uniref:EF-hand domain-containing protein n=1 Tax=Hymenolepis diminuta TaxID=6216 RepID=A0A0R3SDL5_HYMDI